MKDKIKDISGLSIVASIRFWNPSWEQVITSNYATLPSRNEDKGLDVWMSMDEFERMWMLNLQRMRNVGLTS